MGDAGMSTTADRLLETANGQPQAVLDEGRTHLAELGSPDHVERSKTLRALSVSSRILGHFDEAISYADQARADAEIAGDVDQQVLAALTGAGALTISGRAGDGMALVEAVRSLASTPYLAARCSYQTAVILNLTGDLTGAIDAFESALPAFRDEDDRLMTRSTLQGLGDLRITTGDLSGARRDLLEALAIAEGQGHLPAVSGIQHNLGLVHAYRGDIPEALRLLQASDQIYMDLTGDSAPQHVARCEVLISAGLYREAYRLATAIAEARRLAGDGNHLRNALIVAARAALLGGRSEEAMIAAEEALSLIEAASGFGTDLEVRQTIVEARHRTEGSSPELLAEVLEIVGLLEGAGQAVAAAQAQLLAARIALDVGDHAAATNALTVVSSIAVGPPELLLQSHVARARLALGEGDTRRAGTAVRSGLHLLDRYQSTLGATELRLGIERQVEELAALSIDLAVSSRRPRQILLSLDRTRARALRHRPVVPAGDEQTRAMLEELRQIDAAVGEPGDHDMAALMERRRRLQDAIAASERTRRGSGESRESLDFGELMDVLGDRSLLELGFHGDRLIGVRIARGRARLLEMGGRGEISRELRRARFAMRRAARLGRDLEPSTMKRLDDLLLHGATLQSEDVIVVPPPSLMAVPWAGLPTLTGLAVSVTPSAEMWCRASRAPVSVDRSTLVAAGPDLAMAESEVATISALYPSAETLPAGSTVEAVRAAMGRVGTAHIACHATFSLENPMFSSLRLGDGHLNVYDLERLESAPSLVVLSACDSGYTETDTGDELAGLTSALLSMGTRTVVASVGLVPDSPITPGLMEMFHRRLISGLQPARALAAAQTDVMADPAGFAAASSFICVGA